MIDINWRPSTRELRQFAGLWLVFFGLIGFWKGGRVGVGLLGLASVVGLPGLLVPALMRPIYVAWMVLAFPIGWTVSHLLLGAIYYLLLTPIGLLVRLSGHDPMCRGFDPEAASYWIEHRTGEDPASYLRQF